MLALEGWECGMVEPVSTSLLIGAGAGWFANKVFGPSADALGQELKAYSSSRLGKIFKRAAERSKPEQVEALPPGFVVTFFQKASFSEDDESLTEMWANLLAQAATEESGAREQDDSISSTRGGYRCAPPGSLAGPRGFEASQGPHVYNARRRDRR